MNLTCSHLQSAASFPRPQRRFLLGSLLLASLALASACGGGGGGGGGDGIGDTAVSPSPSPGASDGPAPLAPAPNPASGPEAIGVFAGFTGDVGWVVSGLQGDGGVGGGGDGDGGVGAGGSLGQFRNALVYATLDDGTRLGPATTDPASGMVTIRPGRSYAGSLLVELAGQAGSEYFDEAKNAWVAFPAGQVLRAHVERIRGNIGLTPLSDAAVAHAENDLQLAQLPLAERARQSNERVRLAINSQLPASYAVDHVTTLPVLINAASGRGALPDTPAGRYGSVIAALTFVGSQFNPPLPAPGLSIATQLSRDLADGRIDGAGPDGAELAAADQLAYESTQLPGELVAGIDRVTSRYGVDAGNPPLPQVVEFGQYQAQRIQFTARLMSDGRVLVSSPGAAEAPLPVDPTIPGTALPATALFGDGAALLVRRVDGSVQAVGTNQFPRNTEPATFRFGVASDGDPVVPVAAAAALSQANGASDIVFGAGHGLARTVDGRTLAWGDNGAGQLGLDGGAQVAPQAVPLPAGARSVAASLDYSLALLVDGRVFSWGSERQGALGRGANAVFEQPPGPVLTASGAALDGVVSVLAAEATAIALRTDGTVWGWGLATQGRLGDEPQALRYLAAPVAGLAAIRKVVSVEGGLVALDQAGTVLYWGLQGGAGQATRVPPTPIGGLPRIRDLQDRGAGNVVALGFGDEVISIGAFGAVLR